MDESSEKSNYSEAGAFFLTTNESADSNNVESTADVQREGASDAPSVNSNELDQQESPAYDSTDVIANNPIDDVVSEPEHTEPTGQPVDQSKSADSDADSNSSRPASPQQPDADTGSHSNAPNSTKKQTRRRKIRPINNAKVADRIPKPTQRRSRSAEPVGSKTKKNTNILLARKASNQQQSPSSDRTKTVRPGDSRVQNGRHVSFEGDFSSQRRSRSESVVPVITPPISNQIKLLQKLAELQTLMSRDYRVEARLCYRRGLAESGCAAILRRLAMDAETALQQQQQQLVDGRNAQSSRNHISRPVTSANRLPIAAETTAAHGNKSKISSKHSQQSKLPKVK